MPYPVSPASRCVAIIINPSKNVAVDFKTTLLDICLEEGWAEPLWLETTEDDPGAGQARQALEEDVDLVIAAGGDGTVRCVADVLAGTDTPLGLIPLGTGNLLARNLGLDVTDPSLPPDWPLRTVKTGPSMSSKPWWTMPRTSRRSSSWPVSASTPPSWPIRTTC
ncbi:diacylglycerol/lipid kinase family protein [Arthrobacter sp. A5]|uniref:diacylglycerol/lipid kinase family protein n=1 Tax=Arthrobacter sp. A5 TaxID=576926 RepID=UPI003DA8B78E